ncbi:MAG: DUF1735 domain-containing protein, partial [Dysgonamonadaceae bacterium]|nr:DUF1735 domain-containing protein [Dysgonamonadaceae bacterium]
MKVKTLLLTGCLSLLGACNESEYDLENLVPEEYHKILYVNNSGKQEVTLFDIEDDYTCTLSVVKSGSEPDQTATASIRILTQQEVDDKYSAPENVNYKIISENSYSLEATQVNFSVEDRYKTVVISLKPQQVKASLETDPEASWILPLLVVSETDSINAEKNEMFLQIKDVVMPTIGFVDVAVNLTDYNYGVVSTITENIPITLDIDNKWDLEWDIEVDNDYIATYNAANNSQFKPLPEGTYTLPETMNLGSGVTTTQLTATIAGNELDLGNYMLPVRIKNPSLFAVSSTNGVYPLAIRILAQEIDRTEWAAEASTTDSDGNVAANLLDGNVDTQWQSAWSGGGASVALPHVLTFDTKGEYTFTHFALCQRNVGTDWMDTRSGEFYVSSDGETWEKVGTFEDLHKSTDRHIFAVDV